MADGACKEKQHELQGHQSGGKAGARALEEDGGQPEASRPGGKAEACPLEEVAGK